jgi:hypothetical protein
VDLLIKNNVTQRNKTKAAIMKLKWQTSTEILSSKIDEEAILMSIEADSYFGLDSVGSRIWELLSIKPATAEDLVVLLMDDYDIDKKTCQEDVQLFIDEMSVKKLIHPVIKST